MSKQKTVSIIIPAFNEEENISTLYSVLSKIFEDIKEEMELIFVDDGSNDNTVLEIKALHQKDDRIKLIQFSKNFGKEIAISAGIMHCSGDCAMVFDADLQYPAEEIPNFINAWKAGYEIVIGIRDKKKTSNIIEKTGSVLFYQIMTKIGETEVIPGALDFRLLDKKVIQEFNRFTEHGRVARSLIDWLGFKKTYLRYNEKPRHRGVASYDFIKRFQLAFYGFVTHSLFPLRLAGLIGIMITTASGIFGIATFISQFILNQQAIVFSGPFLLGLLNTFLTGITLMSLGLIALYIARIHVEVTNRPLFVVKNKIGWEKDKV